jgi:hypothetical protein
MLSIIKTIHRQMLLVFFTDLSPRSIKLLDNLLFKNDAKNIQDNSDLSSLNQVYFGYMKKIIQDWIGLRFTDMKAISF